MIMLSTRDCVDGEVLPPRLERRRAPSIDVIPQNDVPCRRPASKDFPRRALRTLLSRLRLRRSATAEISTPDPEYKVAYLGNVLTGWAKGEGCVEKPLATLWRNYTQSSRPDVRMQLVVSGGGLKANTKDHGLTEYWAHRITYCGAPKHFPRIFCWVYRHEGRKLRHELRCHAVLCSSNAVARQIESHLRSSLAQALVEFKKDKISRQNARLSLVNSVYDNPSMPRRKILLSTGSTNYRPPLERSKSAPKLTMIEENLGEEDEEFSEDYKKMAEFLVRGCPRLLRHCDSTNSLLDKRLALRQRLAETSELRIPPRIEDVEDEEEDEDDEEILRKNEDIFHEEGLEEKESDDSKEDDLSWFRRSDHPTDLIPLDSDEGSLSSGCESASTFISAEDSSPDDSKDKPEPDFKLGGTVITSIDRLSNCTDIRKYCSLKHHLRMSQEIPDNEEVSLIPVGEISQSDFSSLKVFKKRTLNNGDINIVGDKDCLYDFSVSVSDSGDRIGIGIGKIGDNEEKEETGSACSDESGYDELIENNTDDSPSPISKIVLV